MEPDTPKYRFDPHPSDALDAWVNAWGLKRADHDFSELTKFAEDDSANVVTDGDTPEEEEVPHGA
jgi:hypothetical protein